MSIIYRHPEFDDRGGAEGYRLRVMSTFSGIGAASVSWNPNDFEFVAYAEPTAFPSHVLHYRRSAGRPKYLLDPDEEGISKPERAARKSCPRNVANLPAGGIPNFGDITQITDDDLRALGRVDILEGGSPCQSFSVAGARKGLEDPRGNLLLAFCQLAERMREINNLEFVVWENVHASLSADDGAAFGSLLASLSGETGGALQPPGRKWPNAGRVLGPEGRQVAWRTVEASLWGVPQRRKRVFAVANLGRSAGGFGDPCDILFNHEGTSWGAATGLPTRHAVVSTYRGSGGLEYRGAEQRLTDPAVVARLDVEASADWFKVAPADSGAFAVDMKSIPVASQTAYALTARGDGNHQAAVYALADDYEPKVSRERAFTLLAGSPSGGGHKQVVIHPKVSGTLCASGAGLTRTAGMASELDFIVVTKLPEEDARRWVVRRFTPLECERLQGFPDYWTDVPYKGQLVTDGHRYKGLGNSMPCPVMSFIGHLLSLHIDLFRAVQGDPSILDGETRKRGRPPKYGIAMSDAERQRERRKRLRENPAPADTKSAGLEDLAQRVSGLRAAIDEGAPDVQERLIAIEAGLRRLSK